MKRKILIVVMTLLVVCTLFCTVASAKVYNPIRRSTLYLAFEGESYAYPIYIGYNSSDVDVNTIPQFFDIYSYGSNEFTVLSNGKSPAIDVGYIHCERINDSITVRAKYSDRKWITLYSGKGHDFVLQLYDAERNYRFLLTIFDALDNKLQTVSVDPSTFGDIGYSGDVGYLFDSFYYALYTENELPENVYICYGFPDPDYSHDVIKVITGSIGGLVKDFGSSIGNGFVMLFYPNNQLSSFGIFALSLGGVVIGFFVVNFIIKLFRRKK